MSTVVEIINKVAKAISDFMDSCVKGFDMDRKRISDLENRVSEMDLKIINLTQNQVLQDVNPPP
jgi:hypothetical protein